MLLSEILSMPLINTTDGKIEGVVIDAVFDSAFERVIRLELFDDDAEADERLCIDTDAVTVGTDALFTEARPASASAVSNNPVNVEVYDEEGKRFGRVKDAAIERFEITAFMLDSGRVLPPEGIARIGSVVICKKGAVTVASAAKLKINAADKIFKAAIDKAAAKRKPRAAKSKPDIEETPKFVIEETPEPQIMPEPEITAAETNAADAGGDIFEAIFVDLTTEPQDVGESGIFGQGFEESKGEVSAGSKSNETNMLRYEEIPGLEVTPTKESVGDAGDSGDAPDRILADYTFLLGRVITRDIADTDGKALFVTGELVTAEKVLKASKAGRLLELTKYSKS
ncbi:MAG: hypothetical protein FWE62_02220 [Firmicutes bacterium]|nr:hypothetical protein [Bacillota bacterium]